MIYLAVDSDVGLANSEAEVWKTTRGIGMERVDNMTEGIEKLLSNEYLYIGINSDAVDFMPLLRTMRSVTHTPILIVTGKFDTDDEVAALEAGADLYARWHKTTEGNIASVLAHITRITDQRRTPPPPSNVIVCKKLLIAPLQQSVFIGDNKIDLTVKEFDVLHMLMSNRGCVFSPEQIYTEIWDSHFDESTKEVIRTTMKRLRQKLQIHPQSPEPDYIKNIRDVGYLFDIKY